MMTTKSRRSMLTVGHSGASRARVYVICSHRERAVKLLEPQQVYDRVTRSLVKRLTTYPSDYLAATDYEIIREASDVARLRGLLRDPAP